MSKTYPLTKTDLDLRTYWFNSYIERGFGIEPQHTSLTVDCSSSVSLGLSPRGWRQVISRGGNATSALSGSKRTCKPAAGSFSYQGFGSLFEGYYGYGDGPYGVQHLTNVASASIIANSTADSNARSRFLADYLGKRGAWRGGNFLAEFTETVHMLKHPLQSLYGNTFRFAENVRRIRNLWRFSREAYARRLGQLWLAYSFGWKPLFEDIKDANAALDKLAQGLGHDTVRISGSGRAESYSVLPNQNITPPRCNGVSWLADRHDVTLSEVKYYGAIIARPESFATVRDNFGVAADDLLPAVWEAIPWSFLVDYFINVQEVIDSWHYANANFSWLNKGFKNTNKRIMSGARPSGPQPLVGYRNQVDAGVSVATASAVSRGVSVVPYPSFRFKIPGTQSLKWVNVSALLAAIQRSKP